MADKLEAYCIGKRNHYVTAPGLPASRPKKCPSAVCSQPLKWHDTHGKEFNAISRMLRAVSQPATIEKRPAKGSA